MNLLAIDTSTELASIALKVGNEFFSAEQGSQKTHAQLLLPMIGQLMAQANFCMDQLDAIVFGCGPGSFTGLRVACSIAKGLAYAHDLDLIPVSSLGAIAWSARKVTEEFQFPVLAVLDARMQEMYWSYFAKEKLIAEDKVSAVQDIHLPDETPLILAGVGIDTYWQNMPESIKSRVNTKITLYPKAAEMIQLALTAGIRAVATDKAQPIYVRNHVTQGDVRG